MGLRGNGSPMSIPEDDKMWMMIESSYHSLEFDYAPTPEQVRGASLGCKTEVEASALNAHFALLCEAS